MKKRNGMLNLIMSAFVGAFLGHGLFVVWNDKTHPGLYAMQSAPWYTSILVYGAFTLAVLLVCLVLKAVFKRRGAKKDGN